MASAVCGPARSVHPRAAGALGSAPHLALELDQAESLYQDLVARKRPNALVAPTARDVAFDPHWGSAGTRPAAPLAPEHVGQAAPAPSKGAVAKEAPHKPGNAPAPDAGQGKAPVTQPKGEATKAASGKVAAMFGAAQRKAPAKDSAARPGQGGAEPKAGAVAPGKESAAGPASRAAMEDEESEEDEMARSKRWRAAVIDSESEDEAGAAGPAHAGGGGGAAPAATGGRQGRKLRKEERVTLDDRGRETVEVVWVDAVTGEVVSEGAGAPREAGDAAGSGGAQAAEGPREGPAPAQAGSTKGGAGPKAGSEPSLPKGGPGRPAKGGVVKGSGKGQAAQGGKQQKTVLNFFQKK